jgi:hypothetical protein
MHYKEMECFLIARAVQGRARRCETTQEVGSQKRKGQMQMWTEHEPWCAQIEG